MCYALTLWRGFQVQWPTGLPLDDLELVAEAGVVVGRDADAVAGEAQRDGDAARLGGEAFLVVDAITGEAKIRWR